MPAVILAVAGVLAVHGVRQRQRHAAEVRAFVTALCEEVVAGRDPAPRLGATDRLLAGPVADRLRQTLAATQTVTVHVEAGDGGIHTAVVRAAGNDVLVLRVVHPGTAEGIAIIGFREP